MRRWKELFLLLAVISVFIRLNGPSTQPARVVAEGCIEVGASRTAVEEGLGAQGWTRDEVARRWELYYDENDHLIGAIGHPGRLFFSNRRLLLTQFDRQSVLRALEVRHGCLDCMASSFIYEYQGVKFYSTGDVGLGEHCRP